MRQAVQAALNLQDFVDILDDGEGKINTGYWWSMENIALDQSYVPKQDLEKARRLIKEAGYDPEVGIDVVTVCRSGDPYQCRIQEIVQDQLAEVGIKTSIVAMESGSWRTRTFTQYDFDIYSYSAPAHEIPERFHNLYVYGPSSSNSIGSANAELDAAMELAGASANQEEYEERWKAYQKIFMEQVPYVFLDTPFQYTAQQPYLRGYRNSVAGYNRFQWIADFWFDK
jgi:peptide/nickel transport system substrate-binding protein